MVVYKCLHEGQCPCLTQRNQFPNIFFETESYENFMRLLFDNKKQDWSDFDVTEIL